VLLYIKQQPGSYLDKYKKKCVKLRIGFSWLRTWSSDRLLQTRW
jgi:hypothetical protein